MCPCFPFDDTTFRPAPQSGLLSRSTSFLHFKKNIIFSLWPRRALCGNLWSETEQGDLSMKKNTWFLTLLITVLLLAAGGVLLWRTGFFQAATSLEGLQAYIETFSP